MHFVRHRSTALACEARSPSPASAGSGLGSRMAGWHGSRMRWTGKPVSSEKASAKVPPESASYDACSLAAAFSMSGPHSCRRAGLRYATICSASTGRTSSMSTVCHSPAKHRRTCTAKKGGGRERGQVGARYRVPLALEADLCQKKGDGCFNSGSTVTHGRLGLVTKGKGGQSRPERGRGVRPLLHRRIRRNAQ
eukprot:scaffold8421_cov114-Isochrysis_galbana.AAC.2